MWTLVTQRPHKVALLFPKDTVGIVSTEVQLNSSFLVTSLLKEILQFIPGQHLLLSAVQSKFFSGIFFFFPCRYNVLHGLGRMTVMMTTVVMKPKAAYQGIYASSQMKVGLLLSSVELIIYSM